MNKLGLDFSMASPDGLPGGARIASFEAQHYQAVTRDGEKEGNHPHIAEMLVRLEAVNGGKVNNQKFFESVHAAHLGAQVDRVIIRAGIDHAIEHGYCSARGSNGLRPAFNVFQSTMSEKFVMDVAEQLDKKGMDPGSVVLELLEHQTNFTKKQRDGMILATTVGITLALDDVDPRLEWDRNRMNQLAPSCAIVKLRREVLRDVNNGVYPREQFELDMQELSRGLNFQLVAEGVPKAHQDRMPHCVHYTQSWHDNALLRAVG